MLPVTKFPMLHVGLYHLSVPEGLEYVVSLELFHLEMIYDLLKRDSNEYWSNERRLEAEQTVNRLKELGVAWKI
jgi:hypothetical protein